MCTGSPQTAVAVAVRSHCGVHGCVHPSHEACRVLKLFLQWVDISLKSDGISLSHSTAFIHSAMVSQVWNEVPYKGVREKGLFSRLTICHALLYCVVLLWSAGVWCCLI